MSRFARSFASVSGRWGSTRRSLRGCGFGEEAASKLAAIPNSEALWMADEAITRSDLADRSHSRSRVEAKIERMAENFCDGSQQLNFANASVAELLAFCVAIEKLDQGDPHSPSV
jgi:hypothetical protein